MVGLTNQPKRLVGRGPPPLSKHPLPSGRVEALVAHEAPRLVLLKLHLLQLLCHAQKTQIVWKAWLGWNCHEPWRKLVRNGLEVVIELLDHWSALGPPGLGWHPWQYPQSTLRRYGWNVPELQHKLVGIWFEVGTALVDHWNASGISRSMVTSLAISSEYFTMAWMELP